MIAAIGSGVLVIQVLWLLRPRLATRAAAPRSRPGRRPWIALITIITTLAIVTPVAGLVLMFGAVIWRRASAARRTTRVARQISADYPDALDLLVLSIRAGYVPAQAMVEITPFLPVRLRRSFASVDEAMHSGARFADALQQLPAELGRIAQPLADSLASADRYGLPLAPVLERLAFDARQQRRRDAEAAARELPVRLAMPLVLCTLPSFVLLAIVPLLLGALSSLRI